MDAAADRGLLWDTGDDRSQVFAAVPSVTTDALRVRTAPPSRDISRFAANEEMAAAAFFLRTATRAAR